MALSPDVQVAIVDLRKYRVLCYVRAGRETEIVPILSRFWQKCRFYRSFSSIMEITIFPLSRYSRRDEERYFRNFGLWSTAAETDLR